MGGGCAHLHCTVPQSQVVRQCHTWSHRLQILETRVLEKLLVMVITFLLPCQQKLPASSQISVVVLSIDNDINVIMRNNSIYYTTPKNIITLLESYLLNK